LQAELWEEKESHVLDICVCAYMNGSPVVVDKLSFKVREYHLNYLNGEQDRLMTRKWHVVKCSVAPLDTRTYIHITFSMF
jgi:hypothetical protein